MTFKKLCSVLSLVVLGIVSPQAQDLTELSWRVSAADVVGRPWSSSVLVFTEQTPDTEGGFDLEGYFDWFLSGIPQGRELFRGKLSAIGAIDLAGYELVNPGSIILDVYRAQLSTNNDEIVNGTFGVPEGVAGTWSAKRTLEMSSEQKTPGQLEVCWNIGTSYWYQLQHSPDPAKVPWVPVTAEWTRGSGAAECIQIPIVPEVASDFYQVALTNVPPVQVPQ